MPVVRDAQDLSDEGLGRRIRELARGARDRQLSPDDVRGGTFTITNPGQFGAIAATPIINQPQVAILDLESVVKRAGGHHRDENGNDSIAIRPMTMLCMSWDHRALDGAYAAQFLAALRRRIQAAQPAFPWSAAGAGRESAGRPRARLPAASLVPVKIAAPSSHSAASWMRVGERRGRCRRRA